MAHPLGRDDHVVRCDQNGVGIRVEDAATALWRHRPICHKLSRPAAGCLVTGARLQEAIDVRRQPLRLSLLLASRLGLNRARRQHRLGRLRLGLRRLRAWRRLGRNRLCLAKRTRDSRQAKATRQQPRVAIFSKTTCYHFCLAWIYCPSSICCRFWVSLTPIPSWRRPCSSRFGSRSRRSRCP